MSVVVSKLLKLVKKSLKGKWKFSYVPARRHVSGRCAVNKNEGDETSKNLVGYRNFMAFAILRNFALK